TPCIKDCPGPKVRPTRDERAPEKTASRRFGSDGWPTNVGCLRRASRENTNLAGLNVSKKLNSPYRAIQNLDQGQESKGACGDSDTCWDVLARKLAVAVLACPIPNV